MFAEMPKPELREIQKHRYFLSLERGYDVDFAEARDDWRRNHESAWRRYRFRLLLSLQRREISRHKWLESQKANCDVGKHAAAEWVARYAADFRRWFDEEFVEEESRQVEV